MSVCDQKGIWFSALQLKQRFYDHIVQYKNDEKNNDYWIITLGWSVRYLNGWSVHISVYNSILKLTRALPFSIPRLAMTIATIYVC